MRETLRVTTLGNLKEEMYVNIEPSMDTQSDISGHIVSGHVDTTAEILSIDRPDERNCSIRFSVGDRFGRYIFQKGYIAINGCSLTVGDVERKSGVFWVHLIPETIQRTTFGLLRVGDTVNIEIERQTQIIVDTINETLERFLEHRLK
jgi:riboflavin synthase